MNHRPIRKYCRLGDAARELLKTAITELGFSARCYDKILKVSRIIADVEESEDIKMRIIYRRRYSIGVWIGKFSFDFILLFLL